MRLEEYLNQMGPGVFDVVYYDKHGHRMEAEDLKPYDFDNMIVLGASVQIDGAESFRLHKNYVVHHVNLDVEIKR